MAKGDTSIIDTTNRKKVSMIYNKSLYFAISQYNLKFELFKNIQI